MWWRPKKAPAEPLTDDGVDAIRAEFAARDRLGELDKV